MSFFDTFFEGMDTPQGLVAGLSSYVAIAGPFFPMFPSLRAIFPPPVGWTSGEATVLATFVCLAIKTFMHSFGRSLKYEVGTVKTSAGIWLLAFFYHFLNRSELTAQSHDPIPMFIYVTLFASPTFAFSAMQIHTARGNG